MHDLRKNEKMSSLPILLAQFVSGQGFGLKHIYKKRGEDFILC